MSQMALSQAARRRGTKVVQWVRGGDVERPRRLVAGRRSAWTVIVVCGGAVVGAISTYPALSVGPFLLAVGGLAALRVLDGTQLVICITILALVAADSTIPGAKTLPFALRYILLAGLALWVMLQRGKRMDSPLNARRSVRTIVTASGALVALAGASTAWSVSPSVTALQVTALLTMVAAIGLLAVRRWGDTALLLADVRVLYWILVCILAVSFVTYILRAPFAYSHHGRFGGVFHSATSLGTVAALAVPLGWGLLSTCRHSAVYWVSIATSTLVLMLSQARGPIIAAVCACAVVVMRGGPRRVVRTGSALVAIAAFLFLVAPTVGLESEVISGMSGRFTRPEGEDYSTRRVAAWNRAIELWEEQPLLGRGFRSTEELFIRERETSTFSFRPNTTHNGYIQVLLELGLLGLAFFVVLLTNILRVAAKGTSPFQIGLLGAVMVGALLQLTESSMLGTGSLFAFVYWLLVAAAVVIASQHRGWVDLAGVARGQEAAVGPGERRRP